MGEAAPKVEIPWREQAIGADEAGKLFGVSGEWFLRTIACLPSFPRRVNRKPAAWIAGEVVDWRERHRDERRAA